jgi:hypothetical protein
MTTPDIFAPGGRQAALNSYPIETAPKIVDALLLLYDSRWYIGFWEDGRWFEETGAYDLNPTAWAPLPSAPVPA